jgi:hypothetical protein
MNSINKNILFIGEMPPYSYNGVSISNKINTDILSRQYNIFYAIEKVDINNNNFIKKIKNIYFNLFNILKL